MNRFNRLLLAGCVAVVLYSTPSAFGQSQHYSPNYAARPVLSPWLDMFRDDPGPLPNYHQFVRPRQQLQRTLAYQNAALQTQGTEIRAMQQRAYQAGQRPDGVMPTGTGAVFMNYSHFYPGMQPLR